MAAVERSYVAARWLADEGAGRRVLLHGDLHLRNVLAGPPGRELVAIDPRACVGDPAFDLVDWITLAARLVTELLALAVRLRKTRDSCATPRHALARTRQVWHGKVQDREL